MISWAGKDPDPRGGGCPAKRNQNVENGRETVNEVEINGKKVKKTW